MLRTSLITGILRIPYPEIRNKLICASTFACSRFPGRVILFIAFVEMVRFELMTPCLQGRCSPNWATPPFQKFGTSFMSHEKQFEIKDFSFVFRSISLHPLYRICRFRHILFRVCTDMNSFIKCWQPPTLPHRLQCSTIGRLSLNHRVRDENGCVP